ncbi:MAG: dihydroxyacetone kinase subunit DhaL [Paracoccus sp. (in: a-proteobacteria)]|nr:dihydroxyacetone kinase subunit DhaL [Paracoccus sp. (in: a-proteobacteria)]
MESFSARQLIGLFRLIACRLSDARVELGLLDGPIGDADHGNSMAEGFAAVVRATAAADEQMPGELMSIAARSFLSAVGATTGPLYAGAMMCAARRFASKPALAPDDIAALIPAFAEGIQQRGKASPGDKTMMDVWAPAARAVIEGRKRGLCALDQLARAETAAIEGREATRAMVASVGRAARLGPRSLGHVDPGAASAVMIISATRDWLAAQSSCAPGGAV